MNRVAYPSNNSSLPSRTDGERASDEMSVIPPTLKVDGLHSLR